MEQFTPVPALIGGILMAIAGLGLIFWNRQFMGVSSIIDGLLPPGIKDIEWRVFFLIGLICGGFVLTNYPPAFEFELPHSYWNLFFGGALVGIGSRLAQGAGKMGWLYPKALAIPFIALLAAFATATLIGYIWGTP